MTNPIFTWTHNGVEYTTNPFKVIPTVEEGGPDDGNAGKPMWKALGMTEEEATTIKNNQQWKQKSAAIKGWGAPALRAPPQLVPNALLIKFLFFRDVFLVRRF